MTAFGGFAGSRRATAWAPAHITGFFEIMDQDPEPLRRGSRGAGLCLQEGVRTTVQITPGTPRQVTTRLNGQPFDARTTKRAVELLMGDATGIVEVAATSTLPIAQGLGMSAAGALSATLALAPLLGKGREPAIESAHTAEVLERTGLADVGGALQGGATVVAQAGCPPYGRFVRFPWTGPVALIALEPPLATKSILADPAARAKIAAAGARLVERILREPTPDLFYDLSQRFAEDSGLATPEILETIQEIERSGAGRAAMTMLGHTIFATGDMGEIIPRLKKRGTVLRTKVAQAGAKLDDGDDGG